MRQEYVNVEFLDGTVITDLQCTSTHVKDGVLVIYEPHENGIPMQNQTENYPLTNIKRWSAKVYR